MDEVNKLVNYLRDNAMKHSVLLDDMGCVIAFSYYDPILAPIPHEACAANTSDVTFGITDPASGINKWSLFSRLTAGMKCLFVCFFFSFYLTFVKVVVCSMELWPNYGLCGGSDGTGREGKRKAAVVLVLLAKRCG